ncbi:hypothetical protein FBU30_001847 [Linnemannia zychae]|nr:hypothetical protein FBU30_001847 [Linnemannia zychae]
MHNNPLEGVDSVSAINGVDDANQASASSTAHPSDSDEGDLPMDVAKRMLTLEGLQVGTEEEIVTKKKSITKFADSARRSLQRRHSSLGPKWVLKSGTVVEDVLFEAGQKLTVHHPIRSFMIDMQDPYTKGLFDGEDWADIKNNLPSAVPYASATSTYMDTFDAVKTVDDLRMRLRHRPDGVELELVYMCLQNWLNLYEMTSPSPFAIESSLSESWWMSQAWGICSQLTKGVPGCFMLTGDMTGVDSSMRRNHKERLINTAPHVSRKRMGVRADLIWRSVLAPEKDWAIGEAARTWDDLGQKYIHEGTFKLPRQLHDVLVARSMEVGGPEKMRDVLVSGLVIGGIVDVEPLVLYHVPSEYFLKDDYISAN